MPGLIFTSLIFVALSFLPIGDQLVFANNDLVCPPGSRIESDEQGLTTYCLKMSSDGRSVRHGKTIVWFGSGRKQIEANFINGRIVGTWRRWDANGKLVEEKDYPEASKPSLSTRELMGAGNVLPFTPKIGSLETPLPKIQGDARSVFKNASPYLFQIKTAADANRPKQSYGTGFVVDEDGLIMTSFHVVSDSLLGKKELSLFIVHGDDVIPAKVVSFDLISDLAVVKINRRLEGKIPIHETRAPIMGEKLFSLGQPHDLNMGIVEGNFNGFKKTGKIENLTLSSPLNSGMSGGPTLNDEGVLVGVNEAIDRSGQNLSFIVPAQRVRDLLTRYHSRPLVKENEKQSIWDEVNLQLTEATQQLAFEWMTATDQPSQLKGFEVMAPPPSLKCWEKREKLLNTDQVVDFRHCGSIQNIYITPELITGYYDVDFINISGRSQNAFRKAAHSADINRSNT